MTAPAPTQKVTPRHDWVAWLFLRGLALIYLCAFTSFSVQAMGLIGSDGILPLKDFTAMLHNAGARAYFRLPMVFWLSSSDFTINLVCRLGMMFSLLLALDILPRISLAVLYMLYLSLIYAGQDFMTFQWDIFLVEAGFLSIILSFAPVPGIWLLRWLLFRFMFLSGMVKLLSGDETWRHLTALDYHFFTQPLPTPLAWYAAQIPPRMLMAFTASALVIESLVPFLIFTTRRLRLVAASAFMGLELCILLTGNYNFFNLQTMLMCLPLLDDAMLKRMLPEWIKRRMEKRVKATHPRKPVRVVAYTVSALVLFISLVQLNLMFSEDPPPILFTIERVFSPLRMANTYGLFAVMTTERHEIIIEGSDDGAEWREYAFKYKPGDVTRAPSWNIPHQPRLDWQLWFAALEAPQHIPWFPLFLRRLLQNAPPVTALLEKNPFADRPPKFIRARLYDYTFASPKEHAKGIWWNRQLLGLYYPEVRLSGE